MIADKFQKIKEEVMKFKAPKFSWGFAAGLVIVASLSGIGIHMTQMADETDMPQSSIFEYLTNQNVNAPEFIITEEDEFVINNKVSEVAKKKLESETANFIFLDKLLLSYYLSYDGPDKDEVLAALKEGIQYPEESMEILSFEEANNLYDKVIREYKIGLVNSSHLNNPNSIKDVINDYLVLSDFILEKPENLNVTLQGLGAYFELMTNPTETMLQNPDPNLCTLAKVHPDLRHLPEDLNCNF